MREEWLDPDRLSASDQEVYWQCYAAGWIGSDDFLEAARLILGIVRTMKERRGLTDDEVRQECGGPAHDWSVENPRVFGGRSHRFRRMCAALVEQALGIVHGRLPEPALGALYAYEP